MLKLPSQDFNAGKPSSHLIPKKGLTAWLFWWSSGCLTGWLPKKRPVSTNHHEGHPPMVRIYLPIYTWMIDVDRDQCCVHILSMGRIIWELMVNWWFGAKRFRIRPGTLKWQSLSSENPRNINQTINPPSYLSTDGWKNSTRSPFSRSSLPAKNDPMAVSWVRWVASARGVCYLEGLNTTLAGGTGVPQDNVYLMYRTCSRTKHFKIQQQSWISLSKLIQVQRYFFQFSAMRFFWKLSLTRNHHTYHQ